MSAGTERMKALISIKTLCHLKVFVINVCRGRNRENCEADAGPVIAPDDHTFLWFATQDGYVSFISAFKGSFFIAKLAKVQYNDIRTRSYQ